MKLPHFGPSTRRLLNAVGVAALAILAGGILTVIALGRPEPSPAAVIPTPTARTDAPSPAPPASETRAPTPTPTPGATPTPQPSLPAETGWRSIEIEGIHAVTGIVERNGLLVATGTRDGPVGAMATSTDGTTWQPVDFSSSGEAQFYAVVPGESGFAAVATRYPILMGMPEHEFLYSPDGRSWTTAEPPADCVSAAGIVAYGAGFLGLGDRCRTEVPAPADSLHVLASPDGRAWESRTDETMHPGAWATDGRRIVLLQQGDDPAGGWIQVWTSDDAAVTWRQVRAPIPDGFHLSGLLHGHGRYVAPAVWRSGDGDPQPAACISTDGDSWECEINPQPAGELAGRNWLARDVAVTPAGFASLVEYTNDPSFGGDGSTDMVLATSRDGLHWEFSSVPELKNMLPNGIAWTSHGMFSWGGLDRDVTPDAWVPYLVVRVEPLP